MAITIIPASRVVACYMEFHPGTHPAGLVSTSASTMFESSGYALAY